jgi:hypothetical protein
MERVLQTVVHSLQKPSDFIKRKEEDKYACFGSMVEKNGDQK